MDIPLGEYTYEYEAQVWICNNCGAYAKTKEEVKHFETCKAGEAKRWEEYYGNPHSAR